MLSAEGNLTYVALRMLKNRLHISDVNRSHLISIFLCNYYTLII